MKKKLLNQSGQALVELLVAMALAAILLPTLATALTSSREGRAQEKERIQAAALLQEVNEATRAARDNNWASVAVDGAYHPVISGGDWSLSTGPQTTDGFTKEVIISSVQRDQAGAIVETDGTLDPSTKKVITRVSWDVPLPEELTQMAYYSRHKDNTTWVQDAQAEFDTGQFTNTLSTNLTGGEVELAQGTIISWANAEILEGYNSRGLGGGSDLFLDAATNRVFLAIGTSLYAFDVTNRTNITLLGEFNVGATINDIYVVGNFAYVATSGNNAEFQIINFASPAAPVRIRSLDLPGNTIGATVHVRDSYAYVGKALGTAGNQDELFVINVTTPTTAGVTGSLNVAGSVNGMSVLGSYAYLATSVGSAELTIVDISNKSAPAQIGAFNAPGTAVASDVEIIENRVYLVSGANAAGPEFYIIDVANPVAPNLLGSYETGLNVNSLHVVRSRAFIAMERSNEQLSVLNVSDSSSPVLLGSANLQNNDANAVMFSEDIAYIASSKKSSALVTMTGSESPGGYQTSGEYVSATFDAGGAVGLNYLDYGYSLPIGTEIRLQIAANTDNATWEYLGPDGTDASFYTNRQAIPLSASPNRYVRYRVEFSGDGIATPVLENVTLNYSP